MGRKAYNKEQLKEFIDKFIEETGRVPERRDFSNNSDYPSYMQYIREWGSWSEAIITLGYRGTKYPINKNIHVCKTCGKEFKAYGHRVYCSHECRYIDKTKYEKDTHSSNSYGYRKIAFRHYSWECKICGYKEFTNYTKGSKYNMYPVILDVHHIDLNRENNEVKNLAILCPTCHALIHRKIYINIRWHKLFDKILYDLSPEFGGEQAHPREHFR
jgi:Zn finger protein HypA/HybF involved in hydrogenase expression